MLDPVIHLACAVALGFGYLWLRRLEARQNLLGGAVAKMASEKIISAMAAKLVDDMPKDDGDAA